MLLYCLKRIKIQKVKNKSPKHRKRKNDAFISKCAVCDCKKSRFIKKQEATGLLSSLGTNIPLRRIPLVDPLLF